MTPAELKLERERLDMTQTQMAQHLGSPPSTYIKWEKGERRIPKWVPLRLAGTEQLKIKGLDLDEVFQLDQLARKRGITIESLIGEMIRNGLKSETESKETQN